jgi:hypothetical protein
LISTTVACPDWRVEIFTKDGRCDGVESVWATLGLLQYHIRGLNDDGDGIADLQTHFFHAAARNDAFDRMLAHFNDDVGQDVTDLKLLDLANQAVASGNSHAGMIHGARRRVEEEILCVHGLLVEFYFLERFGFC